MRAARGDSILENIPPDFFAPSLFPAPSFAPLARPCAKLVELRIAVVGLTEFCDNLKLERAVSMFDKHGCLFRGNALIRGSNIVVVVVVYSVLKCCHNFVGDSRRQRSSDCRRALAESIHDDGSSMSRRSHSLTFYK